MPLDQLARRYGDGLFAQAVERITQECAERTKNLKAQLFQRGLDSLQIWVQTYSQVEPFRAEALMRALGESLWSAYEAAGLQIGEFEFDEIIREIKSVCEVRKSSVAQELQLHSVRTGRCGDAQLQGFTAHLFRELESSLSRVVREIRLKLDAQALATRTQEATTAPKDQEYDVFVSYAGPDWDPFRSTAKRCPRAGRTASLGCTDRRKGRGQPTSHDRPGNIKVALRSGRAQSRLLRPEVAPGGA